MSAERRPESVATGPALEPRAVIGAESVEAHQKLLDDHRDAVEATSSEHRRHLEGLAPKLRARVEAAGLSGFD